MDSLPEPPAAVWPGTRPHSDFFPGEVSGGPTYANVTVTQAVVERAAGEDLDSSSSHDSVFYDAAPEALSGSEPLPGCPINAATFHG